MEDHNRKLIGAALCLLASACGITQGRKINGDRQDTEAQEPETQEPEAQDLPAPEEPGAGADAARMEPAEEHYSDSYFLLHGGFVAAAPYEFEEVVDPMMPNTKRFFLESSDTDVSAYLEGYFRHRKAWLEPDQIVDLGLFDDAEIRIGTAFPQDSTTSGTISGTGEFYSEATLGWNLVKSWTSTKDKEPRLRTDRTKPSFSLNFELLGGFVTDQVAQDNHAYYMGGLATVVGIPFHEVTPPDSERSHRPRALRKIEMALGNYVGSADFPEFISETSNEVKTNFGQFPAFSQEASLGLRADLHVPLSDTGYLVIKGRLFDELDTSVDVNPWSLMIGYTIPIGGAFFSPADS